MPCTQWRQDRNVLGERTGLFGTVGDPQLESKKKRSLGLATKSRKRKRVTQPLFRQTLLSHWHREFSGQLTACSSCSTLLRITYNLYFIYIQCTRTKSNDRYFIIYTKVTYFSTYFFNLIGQIYIYLIPSFWSNNFFGVLIYFLFTNIPVCYWLLIVENRPRPDYYLV